MQPTEPHPTDEQLFDYMDGSLPRAGMADVAAHLARCRSCADALHGARAALPEVQGTREAMPTDAAARMHGALAAEFELRAPGRIAAAGAAASAGGSGGWRRWLVPALAFALLAAIAGVSVVGLGDDGAGSGGVPAVREGTAEDERARSDAEVVSTAGDAVTSETAPVLAQPQPATSEPREDVRATAPIAPGDDNRKSSEPLPGATPADPGLNSSTDEGIPVIDGGDLGGPIGAAEEPPSPDGFTGTGQAGDDGQLGGAEQGAPASGGATNATAGAAGEICAVSFDGTTPALPGGRVPLRIDRAPFGLVIACG